MSRLIPAAEVEKLAKAKKEEQPSRVKRIAKKVGLGALAVGGAAGATLLAMRPETRKKVFEAAKNPKKAWQGFKERVNQGHRTHYEGSRSRYRDAPHPPGAEARAEAQREAHRASQRAQASARAPSLIKDHGIGHVKTKKEFTKHWHEKAFKAHPDRGGSADQMKKINEEFSSLKDTDWYEKLAMARYWAALAAALVR